MNDNDHDNEALQSNPTTRSMQLDPRSQDPHKTVHIKIHARGSTHKIRTTRSTHQDPHTIHTRATRSMRQEPPSKIHATRSIRQHPRSQYPRNKVNVYRIHATMSTQQGPHNKIHTQDPHNKIHTTRSMQQYPHNIHDNDNDGPIAITMGR